MAAHSMRTYRELLVVLTLSVFAALAYPAAAAQPSVPAGPNLCEDMETYVACAKNFNIACKNRLKLYAMDKFPVECASYDPATALTTPCLNAVESLFDSCYDLSQQSSFSYAACENVLTRGDYTNFGGQCRETSCQCETYTSSLLDSRSDSEDEAQCKAKECAWSVGSAYGGTCSGQCHCTGSQCAVVTDSDCCARVSEASCAADHFYLGLGVDARSGCSSTNDLATTCCVKNKFRWGDGGETWLNCADEGGTCTCNRQVRYGDASSGTWSLPRDASGGSISCSHTVFGDPKYGVAKTCQCSAAPVVTSGSGSSGKHSSSSAICLCFECIASSSRCTSFRQLQLVVHFFCFRSLLKHGHVVVAASVTSHTTHLSFFFSGSTSTTATCNPCCKCWCRVGGVKKKRLSSSFSFVIHFLHTFICLALILPSKKMMSLFSHL